MTDSQGCAPLNLGRLDWGQSGIRPVHEPCASSLQSVWCREITHCVVFYCESLRTLGLASGVLQALSSHWKEAQAHKACFREQLEVMSVGCSPGQTLGADVNGERFPWPVCMRRGLVLGAGWGQDGERAGPLFLQKAVDWKINISSLSSFSSNSVTQIIYLPWVHQTLF